MLEFTALLLWLLFYANLRLSGDALFPASVFTFVWAFCITALWVLGDVFYAIGDFTLLLYLLGAVMFTLGSLIALTGTGIDPAPVVPFTDEQHWRIRRVLEVLLIACAVALPLYLGVVWAEIDFTNPQSLTRLRNMDLNAEIERGPLEIILSNFVVLSLFVAYAYAHLHRTAFDLKWQYRLSVLLFIIYGSALANKGNAILLVLTVLVIEFKKAGSINFRKLAGIVGFVFGFFLLGLFYVNFSYLQLEWSAETMTYLFDAVMGYAFGGVVGFDNIMKNPDQFISNHSILRFFWETANKFGANYPIPSLHADFSQVSDTQEGNVYTFYFAYYMDFGWAGVALILAFLGFLTTKFYVRARPENPAFLIIYATFITGLLFSIFNEQFFLRLNQYVKLSMFLFALYYVVPRIRLRPPDP